MKKNYSLLPVFLLVLLNPMAVNNTIGWIMEQKDGYQFYYRQADAGSKTEYLALIDSGMERVKFFFGEGYKNEFKIYIHPDRHSLDSTWQHDWQMPDFNSECWMVASGVAQQLDVLSPLRWREEACEHDYANRTETQQIITHELVHVFHGQHNLSPDFSNVDRIDWFVEGLAVYASGQCDSARMEAVRNAIAENKIPASLDDFWTGNLRYGLSGSLVMYIDQTFGRNKLIELIVFNQKTGILDALNISEEDLIQNWKQFMSK